MRFLAAALGAIFHRRTPDETVILAWISVDYDLAFEAYISVMGETA